MVTNVSSTKNNTLLAGYTYGYLLDGNIVTKSDNTGITTDYVYNNAGMLTSETVSNALEQIQNTAYSYDDRGNRIGAIGTGYDEYTETYTYDLNNRLTKVVKQVYNEYDHPDNIFSTWYNYDFNGNLFSENVSAIRKSLDNPSITMNVFGTGDDNWNHEVGLTIYNYNVNNQLESVVKDGKTATYTYNPDGYRSSKTVDGITTNHIWNGTQIVAETNSDNTIKALYVYGNRRIYNEQDNVKSYYLYDAHGDTKHLTNSTGGITWDYTYDAFGNEVDLSNDIVDTTTTITEPYNPFRYCGEYYDSETGFIYLRARYYSPEIGRFASEDPISDGLNWYAYCINNPIRYIDPTGYAWTEEDQKAYDALGGDSSLEAIEFKKEIEAATKDWENAKGDIYKENVAHYRAVVAREKAYADGYVDDFDYTRGNNSLVFIGVHAVYRIPMFNHASVIIFADSNSSYFDNGKFKNNKLWGDKIRYATMGAGSVNGLLDSDFNREQDVILENKNEMINTGAYGDETVDQLFTCFEYYNSHTAIDYTLFPGKNSVQQHNSNSFARGLLNAVGIYPSKPPKNLPGWDQPLASASFGQ